MSNFIKRLLVAALLLPVALACTYYGGVYFQALVSVAGVIAFLEWQGMVVRLKDWRPWGVFGFFYIALPCAALVQIRQMPDVGLSMTLWIFLLVWGTDTGAYLTGKLLGRHKLAPSISPGKTWEGAVGGMAFGVAASALYLYATGGPAPFVHAALAAGLSVISQAGDLFESWIKRKCRVKDSGGILPGHGGVLDRIDGLLFVVPVAWVMLNVFMGR